MLDIKAIRKDFPVLKQKMHGYPFVYLDNAATTHKPLTVIKSITGFYKEQNSNIHRGVHTLSRQASDNYEEARETVKDFINASESKEIIFTPGTTSSINMAAFSFGEAFISEGDEIIISEMEHHSNMLPWKVLCSRKNAVLKVLPVDENGCMRYDEFKAMLTPRTKLAAFCYVSNVLGVENPVKQMTEAAHKNGTKVLIDAAQAVQHMKVDVQDLDCDFLAFSGHKIYAGTGIGVLYGKKELLEKLPPYQCGGGMVSSVTLKKTDYGQLPLKFEAGTPNIAAALSLKTAIDYIAAIGYTSIQGHERKLMTYVQDRLSEFKNLKIYAEDKKRFSVTSFNMDRIHAFDVGTVLDKLGIAVRTGTHCAQPLMNALGIKGTVRISFGIYNTQEEIDHLINALIKVERMF